MEEIFFQGEEQKEGKDSQFPTKEDLNKSRPTSRSTFKKSEHLKSFKSIHRIFQSGQVVRMPPVAAFWIADKHESKKVMAGFSVPKRYFQRANKRNLIKRRMREAYRLNKHILKNGLSDTLLVSVMFVYNSPKELSFEEIQSKLIYCLQRLPKSIDEVHK